MITDHADLIARLRDALPKVGEPENIWCVVQGNDLRAAIAAIKALIAEREAALAWNGPIKQPPREPLTPEQIAKAARAIGMWPALSHDSERVLAFVSAILAAAQEKP